MKLRPIQTSFVSGEISPQLYSRIDAPARAQGLATLENMYPLSQGPVVSRHGNQFIGNTKNITGNVRLLPFNLADEDDSLVVEMGAAYIRIYSHEGRITLASQNLIQDHLFEFEYTYWSDVSTGASYTITFDSSTGSVRLQNDSGSSNAAISTPFRALSTTVLHEISGSIESGTGQSRVYIGTTPGASDILSSWIASSGPFSVTFLPTTAAADLYLTLINTGGNGTYSSFSHLDVHKTGGNLEIATTYTDAEIPEIKFQMIAASDEMVLVHKNHPPMLLTRNNYSSWSFVNVTFTASPFGASTLYPSDLTFAQGRMWYVASITYPNRLWGSQSGDYYNLDIGTALDNEAIIYNIVSASKIRWIKGHKSVLLGTESNEYSVNSSSGVITPTDIQIDPQSGYGGTDKVQSISVGDQVVFISMDRKRVRAASFDENQQGWTFPDLTWHASHITQNRIKEISFLRDPYNLILCTLDDDTVITCTYDRLFEANGWSSHPTHSSITGVESTIATINTGGGSIYSISKLSNGVRGINVSHLWSLETSSHLDSAVSHLIDPGKKIYNLDNLNNLTVSVKIDGDLYPDQLVTGNQLTLPVLGISATVGLAFKQKMTLLPIDIGHLGGSGSGVIKHVNKIYARVYESGLPLINGHRPPDRLPVTPMGNSPPLVSDDIKVSNLGNDRKSPITIEQDLPLYLEVQAIFAELGQKGL